MTFGTRRVKASIWSPAVAAAILIAVLTAPAFAQTSEKITLEFWQPYLPPWDEPFVKMAEKFMEAYPHIEVVVTTVTDIHQKLPTAVAGGAGPDVAHIFGPSFVIGFSNGVLEPIDQYLERLPEWNEADILPGFLNTMRFRGRMWAMPEGAQTTSLVYSKEAFRRAGLPEVNYSLNHDELREFARRLTTSDGDKLVTVGFLPEIWNNFINWAYHWGGAVYDEANHKITATHPANVAAMDWTAELYQMYGGYERVEEWASAYDYTNAALYQDRLGMRIFSTYDFYETYFITGGDWEYGYAPPPLMGDPEWAPKGPIAHTDASVVVAGTEHPLEATLLALFNTQIYGEGLLEIAIPSTSISVSRDAVNSGYLPEWYPADLWMQHLDTLLKARPWPMIPILPEYTGNLNSAWAEVMEGRATAIGKLEEIERTMQALLDERLPDWK